MSLLRIPNTVRTPFLVLLATTLLPCLTAVVDGPEVDEPEELPRRTFLGQVVVQGIHLPTTELHAQDPDIEAEPNEDRENGEEGEDRVGQDGPAGADATAQQAPVEASAMVDGQYRHDRAPRATAVRTTEGIDVDGRLDEGIWSDAPAVTDFVQEVPYEGLPASERTEVRFAYDDDAIYVAGMLYDSEPVSGRLTRRDQGQGDFDYLMIRLDSFHDHETAYVFGVNPSGTLLDAVLGAGGGGPGGIGDRSWDPVWTYDARATGEGWSFELRIPFSQLRFSRANEQVWGVHMTRNIHGAQERSVFPFVPVLETGGPSRYAHLDGISGIEPGQRLELLPYVAARGEYLQLDSPDGVGFPDPYRSGSDHFADVGMDLKYRLTSNVTLDATVNPDFGQVELDPSVINLTAFETRYQEQRPFFVEGADIFNFGEGGPAGSTGRGPQLLYSRRIGRAPQGSVPSQAAFSDLASTTTILGAAKVTGRTPNGWSLGFMEAVTAEETADFVDASGDPGRAVVEPLSNYLVGRVRRQIHGGETRFGLIGSAVNRDVAGTGMEGALHSAAYSGGIDFAHEWANRTYRVASTLTASYVEGAPDAVLRTQRSSTRYYQRPDAGHLDLDPGATSLAGYYAMVDVAKQAGAFGAKLAVAAASPGYEVNDMGFQSASDRIIIDTNFSYNEPNPGDFLRRWDVRGSPDAIWNYAGDRVFTEINGNVNIQLLNYWGGGIRLAYNPSTDDDRLTRGGPMARSPSGYSGNFNMNSDSRRDVVGRLGWSWATDEGGSWSSGADLNLTVNPSDNVEIRFGPSFMRRFQVAQYVTSVADPLATGTFGRRAIFADLEQTTVSFDTRVNVTLTPELSVQLYAEPFMSSGDYSGLKEFDRPRAFDFLRYGDDTGTITQQPDGRYRVDPDGAGPASEFTVPNRDFSYRSLLGNAVLRWEWREGSTLYLVWQQRRIDALNNRGPDGSLSWVGDFDFGRDAGDMFSTRPDNIFVVKVDYWLNP
ncbi:MAG: DUF5916 domain-containing protein [Longimicrobiales bacterium]